MLLIKKYFQWICMAGVVFSVFSLYSIMASGPVRNDIHLGIKSLIHEAPPTGSSNRVYYPPLAAWGKIGPEHWSWSPDGVFHHTYDQATYRDVIRQSLVLPFSDFKDLLSWDVKIPFLVPFAWHVFNVLLLSFGYRLVRSGACEYKSSKTFGRQVLIAALYGGAFVLFFQFGRMLWGSSGWDRQYWSTLLIVGLGSFTYFAYCALFISMYLYCILATAGLQVRRKSSAKKQTCIKCGYGLEGLEGKCPECGLEIGAYIPSKLRINHWYLAGMFVVTFFSPVMVASVYSILG